MRVLGITGGTGTGKSTVAALLRKNGCKILDADRIAKRLQRKGTPVFEKLVALFGDAVVDRETGEIDREALGARVFGSESDRLAVNGIVHEAVAAEIKKKLEMLRSRGVRYAVLDVPIPVENGFFDCADVVWAVVANDDVRVERLMKRNRLTEEEAEKRIAAQLSNSEYSALADVVIDNEKGIDELSALVDYEFRRTVEVFGTGIV